MPSWIDRLQRNVRNGRRTSTSSWSRNVGSGSSSQDLAADERMMRRSSVPVTGTMHSLYTRINPQRVIEKTDLWAMAGLNSIHPLLHGLNARWCPIFLHLLTIGEFRGYWVWLWYPGLSLMLVSISILT